MEKYNDSNKEWDENDRLIPGWITHQIAKRLFSNIYILYLTERPKIKREIFPFHLLFFSPFCFFKNIVIFRFLFFHFLISISDFKLNSSFKNIIFDLLIWILILNLFFTKKNFSCLSLISVWNLFTYSRICKSKQKKKRTSIKTLILISFVFYELIFYLVVNNSFQGNNISIEINFFLKIIKYVGVFVVYVYVCVRVLSK